MVAVCYSGTYDHFNETFFGQLLAKSYPLKLVAGLKQLLAGRGCVGTAPVPLARLIYITVVTL